MGEPGRRGPDDGALDAYLREVAAGLAGVPPTAREEIARELRAHLDDGSAAGETAAALVGRLGPGRRLGRALARSRRGEAGMIWRIAGGAARWGVATAAALTVALFAALAVWGVPAATPDQVVEFAAVYGGVTPPREAGHDLVLLLDGRAALFRVNDDRVPEVALAALQREVRPGDRVYVTAYRRFLPADPAGRGVVPVVALRTDTATYLAPPTGSVGAFPPAGGAIMAGATLLAAACLWPDLRRLRARRVATA